MEDEGIDQHTQGGESTVIRGIQKNLVSLFFLVLAGIAFVVLMVYGAYNDPAIQGLLVWLIIGLIALSIILMMREKILMVIILWALLAAVYGIEGAVIHSLGMGDWFSWGVLTFALISVFVYWAGLSKGFQYKHIYIFIVFVIAAWLINAGGWMATGNAYAGDAMARLAGGLKDNIIVGTFFGGC